jgi:hypothetical protein
MTLAGYKIKINISMNQKQNRKLTQWEESGQNQAACLKLQLGWDFYKHVGGLENNPLAASDCSLLGNLGPEQVVEKRHGLKTRSKAKDPLAL